jgi:hypothetical protein
MSPYISLHLAAPRAALLTPAQLARQQRHQQRLASRARRRRLARVRVRVSES